MRLLLLVVVVLFVPGAHSSRGRGIPFIPDQLSRSLTSRGGDQSDSSSGAATTEAATEIATDELTLEQKVQLAMQKLGITPPTESHPQDPRLGDDDTCRDGVCPVPDTSFEKNVDSNEANHRSSRDASRASDYPAVSMEGQSESDSPLQENPEKVAKRIASDMNVDESLVWAALGATATKDEDGRRTYNEVAARDMVQQEIDIIQQIPENSEMVQQLVKEGFDPFLSRRALAFADLNMDNARAILIAEKLDEEEEEAKRKDSKKVPFKTVTVETKLDPTKIETATTEPKKVVKKSDVVFDVTASQVQKIVLESPVPVLLDVYADWCGPCKALGPILEEMAVKAGGAFRLVKINSDNERAVAGALQVSALPTVFGLSNGKIINTFQGMPRSESAMRSFMIGLLTPGHHFDPPVTDEQQREFDELSARLVKIAGSACFSFSARERLQNVVMARLDELLEQGILEAEEAAQTMRTILSNVIRNPYEAKYRKVNLTNKIIARKIGNNHAALALLKNCGFHPDTSDSTFLILGKEKKFVNTAPLTVARDCIDKWIDKMRYEVAKASRQRKDEEDRQRLVLDIDEEGDGDDQVAGEVEQEVDPNLCVIRVRIDGKKKVHSIELDAQDTLISLLEKLPVAMTPEKEVQITCVAKRLAVKSTDTVTMTKSLRELELYPSASVVVAVGGSSKLQTGGLSERASSKKKKKTGTHTMQSVGIYAKDDNAKGELIDGGGGVWYEHDVTDDEAESATKEEQDPNT